jgi:DNA sulfur modification protein DndD
LENIFDNKINSVNSNQSLTFSLSPKEMERMVLIVENIEKLGMEKIESLIQSYNTTVESLNRIKIALDNIPKDNEIGPLRSEISQYNREVGSFEAQLSELKIQENIERHYLTKENKAIRTNLEKKFSDKKVLDGLELGPKIQLVLKEYSDLLRAKKLELLENYILDGLKMLLHKQDFIDKIKINKETFEVKLFKGNDDEITKDMLSKGELQMFATAVVWGLAKTSDRPLPFVIDTPIARLDDEHRNNLIDNFFPYASHQIVIFSTNAEINDKLYRKLKPFIAHSFIIQFDSEIGTTIQQKGYFTAKPGGKIIEVQQA